MIKSSIVNILMRLGYQVSLTRDPFAEQKRLLRGIKEPVIFDVGAHVGSTCSTYRHILPDSMVYAFEPSPETFQSLKENTKNDSRVKLFSVGLSDVAGSLEFSKNLSPSTNSLLETDSNCIETWGKGLLETSERISLPFTTVDDIVSENGIDRIDLMKMDVQGAEHLVMKGALRTLAEKKIKLIYTEVIVGSTYKDQLKLPEILEIFYINGFELHDIYNLSRSKHGKLRQVDAIFTQA